jgi:threonine/homoserine/homoserine lactone efflux protein
VPNKIVIWISVIVWVLSIVAVFVTQSNDIANAVVLLVSFWLMYLGWSWNRKQRGGT